jgi:hypothetical protein
MTGRTLLSGTLLAASVLTVTVPAPGAGAAPAVAGTPLPAAGQAYTYTSLITLWEDAGGSTATAAVAACHAWHESTGRWWVITPNPDGGQNAGLWQLDTPGGKGAGYTPAQLENPLLNAQRAVAGTDDGTDWSHWSSSGTGCQAVTTTQGGQ